MKINKLPLELRYIIHDFYLNNLGFNIYDLINKVKSPEEQGKLSNWIGNEEEDINGKDEVSFITKVKPRIIGKK